MVSPDGKEKTLTINQDAWIYYGYYKKAHNLEYVIKPDNGVYVFVVEGQLKIADHVLKTRDALEVSHEKCFTLHIEENTKVLIFEVPMLRM